MQFMRCKCGEEEYYHSGMPPRECQGCEKCGTTYGYDPGDHRPVAPHDWEKRFDPRTGEPSGARCRRCLHRDKTIDHATIDRAAA